MVNETSDISLHIAVLGTTGIRLLPHVPVDSRNLALLTGTGLHITHVPANKQVREILIYDVAFMPSVSAETKQHPEVARQTDYRCGPDSRYSLMGQLDILDEFASEDGNRLKIFVYMADLRTLLLLCGDIESNPGPSNGDRKPQNQETDGVGLHIFIFLQNNLCHIVPMYWICPY